MSKINQVKDFIKEKAQLFGATVENENKKDYVWRDNTGADKLEDNGAYFGFISPDNQQVGPFHDFSYTIFPAADDKEWLCCLGIGTEGLMDDHELALQPGVRRLFSSLLVNEKSFCKTSFLDLETSVSKKISAFTPHLKRTIQMYSKFLPVIQVVDDPLSDEGKSILTAFLAAYAKIREWPNNKAQREDVNSALGVLQKQEKADYLKEVFELLNFRRYVILQGAPGTGKTRLAKQMAQKMNAKIFFTQFHAETSYSDFIHGIVPDTNAGHLTYTEKEGVFLKALNFAIQNPQQSVTLIIDEMNRANLASVLGPTFYLFEYQNADSRTEVHIGGGKTISEIPANLYVIGTMNTADRSLAVVDFALRRRFAWYTLAPQKLDHRNFYEGDFDTLQNIFYWYASHDELNLQPGHALFLASSDEEMLHRLKYEVLPLIREYLAEGIMIKAKEELNQYFIERTGVSLEL